MCDSVAETLLPAESENLICFLSLEVDVSPSLNVLSFLSCETLQEGIRLNDLYKIFSSFEHKYSFSSFFQGVLPNDHFEKEIPSQSSPVRPGSAWLPALLPLSSLLLLIDWESVLS